MIKFANVFAVIILCLVVNPCRAQDQDWPTFRGPNGSDISPDTGLLKKWPDDGPEQLWVFEDAGMGYSGFSIVDGKLYTMGTKGEVVHMVCVDIEDGSLVWSEGFTTDDQEGYNVGWGHGPRGTPTVSGDKVYGLGPKGVLVCVGIKDGKKLWSADLVKDFSGKSGGWGFAESPFVDGDKVIVAPGGKQTGIVAFNRHTGKVIWKSEEVQPGKAEYATIVPANINGQKQYIRFFEKIFVSVDAETGKKLWEGEFPKGRTAVIPTPIVDGNTVYVTAGYGSGCRSFTVTEDNKLEENWTNEVMKNHHGGVVKFGDYLYGFSDGAGLICQDWKTGELVWNEKDRQYLSKGAVHIADGMIYALNEENGVLSLVEATPEGFTLNGRFELSPQSENRSNRGKVWTHPVVLNGKLYLRDQEFLHCYSVKDKE